MTRQRDAANYGETFIDFILKNIDNFPTTKQNRRYLRGAVERYARMFISQNGYNPQSLIEHLKNTRREKLVIKLKTPESIQRKEEEIDGHIENVIKDAGTYVLEELTRLLRHRSRIGDIGEMGRYIEGIVRLAPYYGENGGAEHISLVEKSWSDVAETTLTLAANEKFDPYQTPARVHREASKLGELLRRYKIHPNENHINRIIENMYKRAFDELLPKALKEIDDGDRRDVEQDIRLTFEYGQHAGVSVEELRGIKQKMLETNEWRGKILTDVGEVFQKSTGTWPYDSLNSYVQDRGQELIDTPKRVHAAIEEATEIVEELEREK